MAECLTVLIVNWNRRADLMNLLEDLSAQTELADEIIVVDNGSTDGSSDEVERKFPAVRLTRLHKNMGLSFGRNVGIAAAKSESIAILDNDLRILDRAFLAKMRQSLEHHSDCGVISFQQILGLWSKPGESLLWTTLTELEQMAQRGESPVPALWFYDWFFWGGACVIRKSVFDALGLFDDFFAYGGEEWDFAYRCHAKEIRLVRDTSLWVIHALSPQMRSKSAPALILQNMIIAQARYMPMSDLLIFLGMQWGKSFVDSLRNRTLGEFVWAWWRVARNWLPYVMTQRQTVSPQTMQRFYYLRTYQVVKYEAVEASIMTARQFYRSRARKKTSEQIEVASFVYMA